MKQNNSTELCGYSSNNSCNINDLPEPLDPKLGTTKTGYGITSVGCRGGSRYDEG